MKVVGLITEYNPFHNGHLYHIKKAKEITGADYILAVMSGNFVQRGTPAIMPKHLRAEAALKAGVSAIIELPVCFAAGSAEYFAAGAVSIFEKLNCIDMICFGSECGDLDILKEIAYITADEPPKYRHILQSNIHKGCSFPLARQIALKACLADERIDTVLQQPNNILGIEYIKALYQKNSSIKINTIKRIQSEYHDKELRNDFSSASAIRELFAGIGELFCQEKDGSFINPALSRTLTRLEGQVPSFCISLLKEAYWKRYPVYADDFSLLLKYKLMSESADSLMQYVDITKDLANRIVRHRNDFITFNQFCSLIKTRDMTHARISRCLFHILLHITDMNMSEYKKNGFCQYARILGFRKDSAELLTHFKKHSKVPLITRPAQTNHLSSVGLNMLNQDILSADLYESLVTDKFKLPFISDYKQQIIRI